MRLDVYLVREGYMDSRERAKRAIVSGGVRLDGRTAVRCAEEVSENAPHTVEIVNRERYVSRGGYKLEGALETFGICVEGLCGLDVGASTGGFTDCLLKHGAVRVYAVEGGEGQLHPSLQGDSRVVSLERCNARYLTAQMLGADFSPVDIVVMDVSFISQTCILPVLIPLMKPTGKIVTLVKPQFEAGRSAIGKGGLVRRAEDRENGVLRVLDFAKTLGLLCTGFCVSPILGGDGNTEYLACLVPGAGETTPIGAGQIHRIVMGSTKA